MGEARASRGRPEASERAEADLQALRFGASAREVLREARASAGPPLFGVRGGARGPSAACLLGALPGGAVQAVAPGELREAGGGEG
jgi:hypothetical protein